jgi:hypothetical protein
MDLEHELRRSLKRLGDGLDLPAAGVDAVVATAHRRHRRRQAVGAATTAAVIAVTAIGVTRLGDDGQGGEFRSASGGADTVAPEHADPLQWSVLDPQGEIGFARTTIVGDDGTIYALSTAPGATWEDTTSLAQVVWRSTDGAEWVAQEQGDAFGISALDERDGVLYAVGTAPTTAEVAGDYGAVAATSADGGATWSSVSLPLDLGSPAPGVQRSVGGASIATGAAGTVAVVTTWDSLDGSLFPDLMTEPRPEGLALYGPVTDPNAACDAIREDLGASRPDPSGAAPDTVATTTPLVDADDLVMPEVGVTTPPSTAVDWADVSVDPREAAGQDLVECEFDGERRTYLAPTRLDRVEPWADLGIDPAYGAQLAAGGGSARHVFVERDGAYVPVDVPFAAANGVDLLATADGFLAVATDAPVDGPSTASVWRSADGATWESVGVDLLGPNGWVQAGAVVDGAVVLVTGGDDPAVVTSADGVDWTAVRLRDVVGAPAGTSVWVSSAAVGQAGAAVAVGVDRAGGSGPSDITLATSPDGRAWATQPLTDLVGTSVSTGWMAVTDRVLVDVTVGGDPGVVGDEHHEVLQGLPVG